MTREEAIETLGHVVPFATQNGEKIAEAIDIAIEAIRHDVIFEQIKWERDVALQTLEEHGIGLGQKCDAEVVSADAVQGWRIGKPTEQGGYMVTLDSFGHKHIDLFYYGKPLMPNRKVRGKCWYRSDDEWGDVVYDNTDILAWMPLPTPYKGGDDE